MQCDVIGKVITCDITLSLNVMNSVNIGWKQKSAKKVEIGVQIAGKNLGITKTCCDVLSIEVFKQNFESMDGQYTWTVLIFPRYCMQLCRVLKDNVFLDWKIRRSRKIYLLRKHFWINFQRNNGQFLSKKVVSNRMNLIR